MKLYDRKRHCGQKCTDQPFKRREHNGGKDFGEKGNAYHRNLKQQAEEEGQVQMPVFKEYSEYGAFAPHIEGMDKLRNAECRKRHGTCMSNAAEAQSRRKRSKRQCAYEHSLKYDVCPKRNTQK